MIITINYENNLINSNICSKMTEKNCKYPHNDNPHNDKFHYNCYNFII